MPLPTGAPSARTSNTNAPRLVGSATVSVEPPKDPASPNGGAASPNATADRSVSAAPPPPPSTRRSTSQQQQASNTSAAGAASPGQPASPTTAAPSAPALPTGPPRSASNTPAPVVPTTPAGVTPIVVAPSPSAAYGVNPSSNQQQPLQPTPSMSRAPTNPPQNVAAPAAPVTPAPAAANTPASPQPSFSKAPPPPPPPPTTPSGRVVMKSVPAAPQVPPGSQTAAAAAPPTPRASALAPPASVPTPLQPQPSRAIPATPSTAAAAAPVSQPATPLPAGPPKSVLPTGPPGSVNRSSSVTFTNAVTTSAAAPPDQVAASQQAQQQQQQQRSASGDALQTQKSVAPPPPMSRTNHGYDRSASAQRQGAQSPTRATTPYTAQSQSQQVQGQRLYASPSVSVNNNGNSGAAAAASQSQYATPLTTRSGTYVPPPPGGSNKKAPPPPPSSRRGPSHSPPSRYGSSGSNNANTQRNQYSRLPQDTHSVAGVHLGGPSTSLPGMRDGAATNPYTRYDYAARHERERRAIEDKERAIARMSSSSWSGNNIPRDPLPYVSPRRNGYNVEAPTDSAGNVIPEIYRVDTNRSAFLRPIAAPNYNDASVIVSSSNNNNGMMYDDFGRSAAAMSTFNERSSRMRQQHPASPPSSSFATAALAASNAHDGRPISVLVSIEGAVPQAGFLMRLVDIDPVKTTVAQLLAIVEGRLGAKGDRPASSSSAPPRGLLMAPARNMAVSRRLASGASHAARQRWNERFASGAGRPDLDYLPGYDESGGGPWPRHGDDDDDGSGAQYDLLAVPSGLLLAEVPVVDGDTLVWRERLRPVPMQDRAVASAVSVAQQQQRLHHQQYQQIPQQQMPQQENVAPAQHLSQRQAPLRVVDVEEERPAAIAGRGYFNSPYATRGGARDQSWQQQHQHQHQRQLQQPSRPYPAIESQRQQVEPLRQRQQQQFLPTPAPTAYDKYRQPAPDGALNHFVPAPGLRDPPPMAHVPEELQHEFFDAYDPPARREAVYGRDEAQQRTRAELIASQLYSRASMQIF